jgi:hypothetical protein
MGNLHHSPAAIGRKDPFRQIEYLDLDEEDPTEDQSQQT